MPKLQTRWVATTAALLLLAGCGGAKLPNTPKKSNLSSTAQQPMAQAPQQTLAPVGNPEGLAILQATRQALPTVTGFDATVKSYSEGHYKQGEKVAELRKSTTETRLIWVRPLKLRAEVIQTTNSLLVGAAMATTDGTNITARAQGLLGLIPFHLQITDAKLSNNRGHKLPEYNPKAQLDRLTGPTAVWTVVGEENVGGVPCKAIQVDGVKRLDAEITREIVVLEPATLNLRKLLAYAGTTKVVDHSISKFRWNPKVQASSFEL